MCAECKEAHDLLRKAGYSEKAAMSYLWNETAYPIAPGKNTLARVKRHLRYEASKRKASPKPRRKRNKT